MDWKFIITFIYCYNITGNPVKAETSNEYLNEKDKTYYYVNGDITVTGTMNLAPEDPNGGDPVISLASSPGSIYINEIIRNRYGSCINHISGTIAAN